MRLLDPVFFNSSRSVKALADYNVKVSEESGVQNICIVTTSRAEYGLIYPVIRAIEASKRLRYHLVVSGTHLTEQFGYTIREIENDQIPIYACVEGFMSSDSTVGVAKSIGATIISLSDTLRRMNPDAVLILGDRYEMIGVAVTALVMKLPIIHIAGGDLTLGSMDDVIRHAITKLSSIHFVSTMDSGRRVLQMGEYPKRIHVVGSTALDNIRQTTLLSRDEIEEYLDFKLVPPVVLVTCHPETMGPQKESSSLSVLLRALDQVEGLRMIFTCPNADTQGRRMREMIKGYVKKNMDRAIYKDSLGRQLYLSTLNAVDGIVGNSSSGLTEAPSFKIGTVNIGARQTGRVRASTIVDCQVTVDSIVGAIRRILDDDFVRSSINVVNPYGDGFSSERIVSILEKVNFTEIINNGFFDIRLPDRVDRLLSKGV